MLLKYIFYLFLAIALVSCTIAIPASKVKGYPTDIYYRNDIPDQPYTAIDYVYLNDERPNQANKYIREDLIEQYGQLPKSYTYNEKEYLLYQLSKKAKDLGADALVEVEYQLYIKKEVYGYNLKGLAVRYTQPKNNYRNH
ncbi:MAG: hypothetical protein ACFB0B_04635 [Thermonemataceae bacterium]